MSETWSLAAVAATASNTLLAGTISSRIAWLKRSAIRAADVNSRRSSSLSAGAIVGHVDACQADGHHNGLARTSCLQSGRERRKRPRFSQRDEQPPLRD